MCVGTYTQSYHGGHDYVKGCMVRGITQFRNYLQCTLFNMIDLPRILTLKAEKKPPPHVGQHYIIHIVKIVTNAMIGTVGVLLGYWKHA